MTKLCNFKRDTPQDVDIVKNIYLVKRQERFAKSLAALLIGSCGMSSRRSGCTQTVLRSLRKLHANMNRQY